MQLIFFVLISDVEAAAFSIISASKPHAFTFIDSASEIMLYNFMS